MSRIENLINPVFLKYCRYGAIASMTIAFYFMVKIFTVELLTPELIAPAIWYLWFYSSTLSIVICIIPLWFDKIKRIKAFQADLNKVYGDNEHMKNQAIAQSFMPFIKQAMVAFLLAVAIYYFVSMFILTPDIKQHYIDSVLLRSGRIPSEFNFSNITVLNSTPLNNTIGD